MPFFPSCSVLRLALRNMINFDDGIGKSGRDGLDSARAGQSNGDACATAGMGAASLACLRAAGLALSSIRPADDG